MKNVLTILLLFFVITLVAQPTTRMSLNFLQASPDETKTYFLVTDGDTTIHAIDVISIDSTGRVFTIIIGSDTIQFQDQTGGGGGWLKDSLEVQDVAIGAAGNDLSITGMGLLTLRADTVNFGELGTRIIYPSLVYNEYNNVTNTIGESRTYQIKSINSSQTYPFFSISEGSGYININSALVDTFGLVKVGLDDNTPPDGNGYIGYADQDSTLAIYYNSAWHPLAWRSEVVGGGTVIAHNGLSSSGDTILLGGGLDRTTVFDMNNQVIEFNADNSGQTDFNAVTDSIFVRFIDGRGVAYGFAVGDSDQPGYFVIDDIKSSGSSNLIEWNETDMVKVGSSFSDSLTLSFSKLFFEDANFFGLDTMPAGTVDYLIGIDESTGRVGPTSQLSGGSSGGSSEFYDPYDQADTLTQNITVKGGDYGLNFDSLDVLEITDYGNNVGLRILNDVDLASGKAFHTPLTLGNGADSLRIYQEAADNDTTKIVLDVNTGLSINGDNVEFETNSTNFDIGLKDSPGLLLDNGSFNIARDAATYTTVFRGEGTGLSDFDLYRGDGNGSIPVSSDEAIGFFFNCNIITTIVGTSNMEEGDHYLITGRGLVKNIGGTTTASWAVVSGSSLIRDGDMLDAGINITADDTNDELDISITPPQAQGSSDMVNRAVCRFEFQYLNW
jgi:hypothetical protein